MSVRALIIVAFLVTTRVQAVDPPGLLARHGDSRLRHGAEINAYTFSPDSKTLVTVSDLVGTLKIWDVVTGTMKAEVQVLPDAKNDSFNAIHFDTKGQLRIVRQLGAAECQILRLDPATGKILHRAVITEGSTYNSVFDPLGRWLYVLSTVRVKKYDLNTGQVVGSYMVKNPGQNPVAVSADGRMLACVNDKNSIDVIDTETGAQLYRSQSHKNNLLWFQFTPDAKGLLIQTRNETLKLWDFASGEDRFDSRAMKPRAMSPLEAFALDTSRDSIFLSRTGFIRIVTNSKLEQRNWAAGRLDRSWNIGEKLAGGMALAPDECTLAIFYGNTNIRFYDLTTSRFLPQSASWKWELSKLQSPARGVIHGYDKNYNTAFYWNLNTESKPRMVPLPRGDFNIYDMRANDILLTKNPVFLTIYDTDKRQYNGQFRTGNLTTSPIFVSNGTQIAIPRQDTFLTVINRKTGQECNVKGLPKDYECRFVSATTDPMRIVAVGGQAIPGVNEPLTAYVINPMTGQILQTTPIGIINYIAMTPDGQTLAVFTKHDPNKDGLNDETCSKLTLNIFNINTSELINAGVFATSSVSSISISPDGRTVVVITKDQQLTLIEVATLKPRVRFQFRELNTDRHVVHTFSPDGKELYIATQTDPIQVWDVRGLTTSPQPIPKGYDAKQAWSDISSESAMVGYNAIRYFAKNPAVALQTFQQELPVAKSVSADTVRSIALAWKDGSFREREQATAKLKAIGKVAKGTIADIASTTTDPEVSARAKALLEDWKGITTDDRVIIRAVEAVEWIGTPAAKTLLKAWAEGDSQATLTQEARQALKRIP